MRWEGDLFRLSFHSFIASREITRTMTTIKEQHFYRFVREDSITRCVIKETFRFKRSRLFSHWFDRDIQCLRVFSIDSLTRSFVFYQWPTKSVDHEANEKEETFSFANRSMVLFKRKAYAFALHVNYIDSVCTVIADKWIRESGQFSTPIIYFFNISCYRSANTGNLTTADRTRFVQRLSQFFPRSIGKLDDWYRHSTNSLLPRVLLNHFPFHYQVPTTNPITIYKAAQKRESDDERIYPVTSIS